MLLSLTILIVALVWPPIIVVLTYIADWRAFAPGTGPHKWERALFPSASTQKSIRRSPAVPPPIPQAQLLAPLPRRSRRILKSLKITFVVLLGSLGTGLIVGRWEAVVGAFFLLGAFFLYRSSTTQP
jgi:hypothetical protein